MFRPAFYQLLKCKRIRLPGSTISAVWMIFFLLFLTSTLPCQGQVLVKKKSVLMGSLFEITLTGDDSLHLAKCLERVVTEITRIENLISEWNPLTQISEVNRNAGIRPIQVDREVFDLTRRAISYSQLSQGAFDISVAGMDKIWRFDDSMTELPSEADIRLSVEKVGYQHILLDSTASTIFLRYPGMKIGFGSIGKGYAADRGKALMIASGIEGGIVNASGDLATWGHPPRRRTWKIGIASPFKASRVVKTLKIKDSAVSTSGDYQKYAEINGVRYTHIIDPHTGYPSVGLISVTIEGPSAEFANALSTSVMVMGTVRGKELLKEFPDYQYLLITDKGKIIRR